MREEVLLWWKQAQKDLEVAEKNFKIEEFYLVAFLCHQSVEKALKALYIHNLNDSAGKTHSLVHLGKSVGIPEKLISYLKKMTPDFVITRYPDISQEIPYELFDEEIAQERLGFAKEVIAWIQIQLQN